MPDRYALIGQSRASRTSGPPWSTFTIARYVVRSNPGVERLVKLIAIMCATLTSGCATIASSNGCPGDRIGELDCSSGVCRQSYAGEVFYRIAGEPANVQELLSLVEVGRFKHELWYASNTGKFKLYVGGPNNGYAYEFTKVGAGWVAKLERDAYACTS